MIQICCEPNFSPTTFLVQSIYSDSLPLAKMITRVRINLLMNFSHYYHMKFTLKISMRKSLDHFRRPRGSDLTQPIEISDR